MILIVRMLTKHTVFDLSLNLKIHKSLENAIKDKVDRELATL